MRLATSSTWLARRFRDEVSGVHLGLKCWILRQEHELKLFLPELATVPLSEDAGGFSPAEAQFPEVGRCASTLRPFKLWSQKPCERRIQSSCSRPFCRLNPCAVRGCGSASDRLNLLRARRTSQGAPAVSAPEPGMQFGGSRGIFRVDLRPADEGIQRQDLGDVSCLRVWTMDPPPPDRSR